MPLWRNFLIAAAALVQAQQPIIIFNDVVTESEEEEEDSVTGYNDVTECDDVESDTVRWSVAFLRFCFQTFSLRHVERFCFLQYHTATYGTETSLIDPLSGLITWKMYTFDLHKTIRC